MKSDVHLQRDVLDELDWEPSVDASHIGVTANEGLITLAGHVPVFTEKHSAEQVAKRVHGVRGIANEIEVRPSEVHVWNDEDIAAAALYSLMWDAKVPDDKLTITFADGWITIEGNVEAHFQKSAAERAVRHLAGTRGITNDVVVTPKETIDGLERSIEAAYRRSATIDSSKLSVEVDGQTVTLTGDVHSHDECEEAERVAWAAPGVRSLRNPVTVTPWGLGPADEWGY